MIWLEKLVPQRPRVVLTHGEDKPRTALAELIRGKFALDVQTPALRETLTLD
jgi:metallo-beta-lactamase family protein